MPSGHIPLYRDPLAFKSNAPGYEANAVGQVRKSYGNKDILPHVVIEGIPCVQTPKYWKFRRHLREGYTTVADIVALNFKPSYLPLGEITKSSAYPIDGDEFNLHPSNLVWVFPDEGIEVKWLPGYYYVPGYTRYAVNSSGSVYYLPTMTEKATVDLAGAPSVSAAKDSEPHGPAINVYRLMALALRPYPRNAANLVINHKDGDRANCTPDNIEWTTQRENVVHGILRKLLGVAPPSLLYKQSEYNFGNIKSYLEARGIDVPTCLLPENSTTVSVKNGNRKIIRLDVNTGDKKVYNSNSEAIRDSEVRSFQLTQSLQSSSRMFGIGLVNGKYIFRYEGDEFPNVDSSAMKHVLRFGGTKRPVVVRDTKKGSITEYKSASEFVRVSGLSKKVVTSRLAKAIQGIPNSDLLVAYKDQDLKWVDL